MFRTQRHIRTNGMFTTADLPVSHRKTTRQEQFWWIGGEIHMVPAKRDELAHSEASVGE